MSKRRVAAGGVGCTGCLGVVAGASGLALIALLGVGIAVYVVEQQWETAVRSTLAQYTGEEVTFGSLGLGFGRVTIHDLELHDASGAAVLAVAKASVHANPFDLLGHPANWKLTGLRLHGVHLTPHRTDDGFALPEGTLALLRGEGAASLGDLPLPPLTVPEVRLTDVEVELDGHRLTVEALDVPTGASLTLDPLASLSLGPVEARGVGLPAQGVRVDLATFALTHEVDPDTLALTLDGTRLEGIRVALDGLEALVESASADGAVELSLEGEPTLVAGAWSAGAFQIDALQTIRGSEASLRLDALTLQDDDLQVHDLALTALRATAGSTGWPIVGRMLTATDGIPLPTVRAPGVVIHGTTLHAADVMARATTTRTGLTFEPGTRLGWDAGTVQGLSVFVGDQERVTVGELGIPAGGVTPGRPLALDELTARDVAATLLWKQHAFGIPVEAFRLASVQGGMSLATVAIEGLTLKVQGASGTLPVSVASARLDGFALAPDSWRLGSGSLGGIRVDDGRLWAKVDRVGLGSDHVVEVAGAQVWTRIGNQRHLDLPHVAKEHVPGWLGGSFGGDTDFFGVAFPGSPWVPARLRVSSVVVHVVDDAIASESTTWDVPLAITLGPHTDSGNLPVSLTGTFVDGDLSMSGTLQPNNTLTASVEARSLQLGDLGMYLDEPLSRWGLRIEQGRADSDLDLTLRGAHVRLEGKGTGIGLKLGGSALAGVANTGFDVVKGSDNGVSVPITIEGDLSDPAFSPIDLLIASYTKGIQNAVDLSGLGEVGDSVKRLVGNVTGGPDEGTDRADQSGAGEQVDGAVDNVKGALKDVFGGGNKGRKKKRR